jgi:hypothetical protein
MGAASKAFERAQFNAMRYRSTRIARYAAACVGRRIVGRPGSSRKVGRARSE